MICNRTAHRFWTASLSLLVGLAILADPIAAVAQAYKPPQRGIPGRREGAGTRTGACLVGSRTLMPLTPIDSFSTSATDAPTFFWYVPLTIAKTAEFRLLDANNREVYTTTVLLQNLPGVVSYTLPSEVTTKLISLGKDYQWQFSVLCDSAQPSKNPFVEGTFQRVPLDTTVEADLNKASDRDRPSIYAEAGIWQDALTSLVQQRCTNPADAALTSRWNTLLGSVELQDYTNVPLAPTCAAIGFSPLP